MEENKKPNNPFAFPYSDSLNGYVQDGMTLRDYFANSAMQGIISSQTVMRSIGMSNDIIGGQIEGICIESYSIADAMLKQREL